MIFSQDSVPSSRVCLAEVLVPADLGGPDPARLRHRKSLKLMDTRTRLLLSAAHAALDNPAVMAVMENTTPEQRAVVVRVGAPALSEPVGTVLRAHAGSNWDDPDRVEAVLHDLPPLSLLEWLPNMPAAHLAIELSARGPNQTLASGTEDASDVARCLAALWLESGRAALVFAADTDPGSGCRLAVWI